MRRGLPPAHPKGNDCMNTLVIYYSYGGNTRKIATQKAQELGADLVEVRDKKRPAPPATFFVGCPRAIRGREGKIQPIETDLSIYDKIIIAGPIWAGNPAPPVNNIVNLLPQGKEVSMLFVSGGGTSGKSAEKYRQRIAEMGCTMTEAIDIQSGGETKS